MRKVLKYSWFLPKAYSWLGRLIPPDKLADAESAQDLKGFLDALRETRLAQHIPLTADPFVIELSLRRFYKREIRTLIGLLPPDAGEAVRLAMLPTFVTEAFEVLRSLRRDETGSVTMRKEAFFTLPERAVDGAVSMGASGKTYSEFIRSFSSLVGEEPYSSFLLKELEAVEGRADLPEAEAYMYLRALGRVRDGLRREGLGLDVRAITCPYVDLESLRTLALYLLARRSAPEIFREAGAIGCAGFERDLAGDPERAVAGMYLRASKAYKLPVPDFKKPLHEVDQEIARQLLERMESSCRKAFRTYPFSISIPVGLLFLLLEEHRALQRGLSKAVYLH